MEINGYDSVRVSLLRATVDPLQLIRMAVDITQKRDFASGKKATGKLVKAMLEMNHASVFEHIGYSFLVEGASRSFLAQVTRHRMASYTSGSQHYQDYSGYGCSVSESLVGNADMEVGLNAAMAAYVKMVESGVPAHEARQVLPNAMQNNLMVTINARSLVNLLNLRLCRRNTAEIYVVAWKMRELAVGHFPELFGCVGPDCFMKGKCTQGLMSCGNVWAPETHHAQ